MGPAGALAARAGLSSLPPNPGQNLSARALAAAIGRPMPAQGVAEPHSGPLAAPAHLCDGSRRVGLRSSRGLGCEAPDPLQGGGQARSSWGRRGCAPHKRSPRERGEHAGLLETISATSMREKDDARPGGLCSRPISFFPAGCQACRVPRYFRRSLRICLRCGRSRPVDPVPNGLRRAVQVSMRSTPVSGCSGCGWHCTTTTTVGRGGLRARCAQIPAQPPAACAVGATSRPCCCFPAPGACR